MAEPIKPGRATGGVNSRGVQFWFMAVRAMIAMIPPVLIALLAHRARPDARRGQGLIRMAIALRRYAPTAIDQQLRYALFSLLAIVAAMVFLFPLYWGLSTSLRTQLETFTIAGFGIPWINFTPTLDNWIDQLQVPETQDALVNSTLIATLATLLD